MISLSSFQKMALALPETTEEPHFEKISFRVKNKIFATYDAKHNMASIKLSPVEQNIFTAADNSGMYPVDNKWGKQGWTLVELNKVNKAVFKDALTLAYCQVAPKRLADAIRQNGMS